MRAARSSTRLFFGFDSTVAHCCQTPGLASSKEKDPPGREPSAGRNVFVCGPNAKDAKDEKKKKRQLTMRSMRVLMYLAEGDQQPQAGSTWLCSFASLATVA